MAHAFFALALLLVACDATTGDPTPASGPNNLCGCEFRAGESCCLLSNAPATCTLDGAGCADKGGVAIGCLGYDPTSESVCCWNGAAAKGSFTRLASTCGSDPTSCATDADCGDGGTCMTQKCGSVRISACNVMPACP